MTGSLENTTRYEGRKKTYVQIFPPALYLRWFFFTLFSHHTKKNAHA